MFTKLFAKPLTLRIAGQDLSFNTLAEFEFALAGRTEVPARKLTDLLDLSPRDLKGEAKSIKHVERQFVDILSKSIENQESVGKHMKKLDPKVFSQDHGWRDIMLALRDKDEDFEELRRVALVKYMQYLTSRQEVIKHTYAVKKITSRKSVSKSEEADADAANVEIGNGTPGMRETVILDSVVLQPESKKKERFARLPKGEAIIIDVTPGTTIDLLLSKHPFKLTMTAKGMRFIDDDEEHDLQHGKNIIGRDTVCNVTVNQAFRDVSRLHVIIEPIDEEQVRFTDLSSHGTFLPNELLVDQTDF